MSTSVITRVESLAKALHTVFEENPQGVRMQEKCRNAVDEIKLHSNKRGVNATVIAVMGVKNSGKSWLCRQLVAEQEWQAKIPCGEEMEFSTRSAFWIGEDAPARLDWSHEDHLRVPAAAMEDLGQRYTLLDLPGYDDAGVEARAAALQAVRTAEFRIIVCSSSTKQVESQFAYLKDSDGMRILPMIMDNQYPRLKNKGAMEVRKLVDTIRRHCPHAHVADALLLPHVDNAPGDSKANLAIARSTLYSGLRALISQRSVDQSVVSRVVLERLKRDLAEDLTEFTTRVGPAFSSLVETETSLAGELIGKTLGDDRHLQTGLRMRMRFHTLSQIPAFLFPFRTFFGIFTLTAGAWDRLAFAMSGSLPSLALLAGQTTANLRRLGEMREKARHALAGRIQSLAVENLIPCNTILMRAIRSAVGGNQVPRDESAPSATRFVGLDQVVDESETIFEKAVTRWAPHKAVVRVLGALATFGFLVLSAGPVYAVYQEFFRGWMSSFADGGSASWTNFPSPSGTMIFASLVLVLLPAMVLALLGSLTSAPGQRVHAALGQVKSEHEKMGDRLASQRLVRLESDDPLREAVVEVLGFLRNQN